MMSYRESGSGSVSDSSHMRKDLVLTSLSRAQSIGLGASNAIRHRRQRHMLRVTLTPEEDVATSRLLGGDEGSLARRSCRSIGRLRDMIGS